MIKTYDGTSYKRLGGKPGDRAPAIGVKRERSLYTAVGGETSINLAATSPALSYLPGNAQIAVKRSSGGALIGSIDFFELSPSSIGFPITDPLIAGEVVEITKEVSVTAVMAATARPDAYTATATAGQTLVQADFSWAYNLNPSKGVGAVDVRLHGVSQTRGVDYTEVNLGTANTNQITFLVALVGGENIQILPLYQALDTSAAATSFNGIQLSNVQSALSAGTQAFVDQSALISVPATTIVGRAKIPDLANDFRASFGVERIPVQSIYQLQNEFGPNGEIVWAAVNDDRGLIRFVGGGWGLLNDSSGVRPGSFVATDYLEITFYGTGLNILAYNNASINYPLIVDGSAGSSVSSPSNSSAVLGARNYVINTILPIVSNLTLGIHTVKLTNASAAMNVYGFEILNATATNTSLNVNPGTAYTGGQKIQALSSQSLAYNSGVTGSTGGRQLVYLTAAGIVASAFTANAPTPSYLSSASHTNEEVARVYNVREFSVSRADLNDFSGLSNTAQNLTFTLDDGTTTLLCKNGRNQAEGVFPNAVGDFTQFTFVGTGLDIYNPGSTVDGAYQFLIDGVSIGTSLTGTAISSTKTVKVASGLPYGTHTFKCIQTATATVAYPLQKFIVYQPKKPALPSGSVELADYNVLPAFIATATASQDTISVGVINKSDTREVVYVGTGWTPTQNSAVQGGWTVSSANNNDNFQYTFFGTGIEIVGNAGTAASLTIVVDGTAYTAAAAALGGGTWTPGTSTWAVTSTNGGRLQISGLAPGLHTIKATISSNTGSFYLHQLAIQTPIHSHKSNLYADLQNTLAVGSQGLSDNRKTSMIKEVLPAQKAWAQAVGVASSPTTSSGSFVPCPDLSVAVKTNGGFLDITYSLTCNSATAGQAVLTAVYVDGAQVGNSRELDASTSSGFVGVISDSMIVPVSAGYHKVDLYWTSTSGASRAYLTYRSLKVREG